MIKFKLVRPVLLGVGIALALCAAQLRWWPDSPLIPATLRQYMAPPPRTTAAQRRPDHLRVLFIGNSFTAFNGGQDTLLEALSQSAGEPFPAICDRVAPDGQTLDGHWARGEALARIREGNWDYVVLQEFSTTPLFDRKAMLVAARKFIPEIRNAGATPLLFMTWPRRDMPDAGPVIQENCLSIGRELGVDVVPVGMAWQMATRENPNVWIYYKDDKHPAGMGTYLTACVFYTHFYGHNPVGLIHRIDPPPRTPQYVNVSDNDAAFLQDVAWRTLVSMPPAVQKDPRLTLNLGGGVTMDLVRIPGGTFTMGSPEDEDGHDASESPPHQVTILRPFYMGEFPVTQEQFQAVMGRNGAAFHGNGKLPMESVTWQEGRDFCTTVTHLTGKRVRLPSEAEWEYACRAGTSTAFNTGASLSSDQANFDGTQPGGEAQAGPNRGKTTPVGLFKPNAFGLYDMHGNVWQWCADRFHDTYDGAPADGSAWMRGENPNFVCRGGSWSNAASACRCAVRYAHEGQNLRTNTIGFRVVMEAQ